MCLLDHVTTRGASDTKHGSDKQAATYHIPHQISYRILKTFSGQMSMAMKGGDTVV